MPKIEGNLWTFVQLPEVSSSMSRYGYSSNFEHIPSEYQEAYQEYRRLQALVYGN